MKHFPLFVFLLWAFSIRAVNVIVDITVQSSPNGLTWSETGFSGTYHLSSDGTDCRFFRASLSHLTNAAPVGYQYVYVKVWSGGDVQNITTLFSNPTVAIKAPYGTNTIYRPTISIRPL